jgi:HEAT repeat protein
MSDSSEGNPELTGLARSFAALFESSPTATPLREDEHEAEGDRANDLDLDLGEVAAGLAPVAAGTELGDDLAGTVEEDAATLDTEPAEASEPVYVEPVYADEEPAFVELDDLQVDVEEPVAETAPPAPQVEGGDDFVPTDLDLAVDAYLAGDEEKGEDIQALGIHMMVGNRTEPVARAVGRVAYAAGEPPDLAVYGVVQALATPVVLRRLAHQMGEERNEERRREYYAACRTIGPDMALAIREDLADSADRLARRVHCEALVEMGDAGREVIEEMAVDENRFLARNAIAILGDTGGDRAVELVTGALANPDPKVRREGLRALAKLGDEEAGQLVIGLLDDTDAEVRLAAAAAAGELHVERALRRLIEMLEGTTDEDEIMTLVRALGKLGDPGAVMSIEKHAVRSILSRNPRTRIRIASYRALNHIGTPHARRLLNKAVSDKDAEVKAAVREMLHLR